MITLGSDGGHVDVEEEDVDVDLPVVTQVFLLRRGGIATLSLYMFILCDKLNVLSVRRMHARFVH